MKKLQHSTLDKTNQASILAIDLLSLWRERLLTIAVLHCCTDALLHHWWSDTAASGVTG